ncbi:MAG: Flp pilus assembly complex ATPase component TadA [Campylobacteraceae bacterium]|nr:Flp pilus assembly complex ATPase component TadA [Campylobacteraceae bacterium]
MDDIEYIHDTNLEPFEIGTEELNIALKNYVLFSKIDNILCACITENYMDVAFEYLSKQGLEYRVVFLDEESYDRLLNKFLELRTDKELGSIDKNAEEEASVDENMNLTEFLRNSGDILTSEESAPIIKFVNSLFYQAIKKRSSDIHIEMHEFKGEIRFRIDGVLTKHIELEKNILNLVISRIKVISNLDISEKRIPQDGRTQIKIAGRTLDIRVSILPVYYGERVVMRILMDSTQIPSLLELGFTDDLIDGLNDILQYSHGIILVTGPTGSGKSTTLHSFLQRLASSEKNIITIEDPVEYKTNNINQIQVNSKVGLTFAAGLRSILRQDPDIVMVGEIRDNETASIATQAALTGHLVLSTLHTNNATAAITRLVDMKIEPFLISSTLLAVLAQRLVRLLCPHCKTEDKIAEDYANQFSIEKDTVIYKANGCKKCGYTGYIGRQAVGELLVMNDEIKTILKTTTNDYQIRSFSRENGMVFLSHRLRQLLYDGKISLDEAIRIGIKDD